MFRALSRVASSCWWFFFFNDTAATEIYTLSLHDALPIWATFLRNHDAADLSRLTADQREQVFAEFGPEPEMQLYGDRKSTRLNSSHANISYAVFCLKKKKDENIVTVVRVLVYAVHGHNIC